MFSPLVATGIPQRNSNLRIFRGIWRLSRYLFSEAFRGVVRIFPGVWRLSPSFPSFALRLSPPFPRNLAVVSTFSQFGGCLHLFPAIWRLSPPFPGIVHLFPAIWRLALKNGALRVLGSHVATSSLRYGVLVHTPLAYPLDN